MPNAILTVASVMLKTESLPVEGYTSDLMRCPYSDIFTLKSLYGGATRYLKLRGNNLSIRARVLSSLDIQLEQSYILECRLWYHS